MKAPLLVTLASIAASAAALAALAAITACGTQQFERGLSVTAPTDLHYGGRAWVGMPRGRARIWVTEAVLIGHIDGFAAAAGGLGLRAPAGTTFRGAAAFGIGGRSLSGDIDGRNGLGPYVEGHVGGDISLGPTAPALTLSIIGSAYLNGDEIEPHLMGAVGFVWK